MGFEDPWDLIAAFSSGHKVNRLNRHRPAINGQGVAGGKRSAVRA